MLIVDGPGARDAPMSPARSMRPAATASAVLHVGIALLLLLRLAPAPPDEIGPIEVELVQQQAQTQGAPAQAQPSSPPPAPDLAVQPGGEAMPRATPAAPAQAGPPAPAVHLGDGSEDVDPLLVTGDNVKPPEPDSRYRNVPPNYPREAARAGAQGTVQLRVRVSSAGVPLGVEIAGSSGNRSLDAEARRAVQLWRFRPAEAGGRAVPYDFVINIRFALGDQ